jgi:hypothetical protein
MKPAKKIKGRPLLLLVICLGVIYWVAINLAWLEMPLTKEEIDFHICFGSMALTDIILQKEKGVIEKEQFASLRSDYLALARSGNFTNPDEAIKMINRVFNALPGERMSYYFPRGIRALYVIDYIRRYETRWKWNPWTYFVSADEFLTQREELNRRIDSFYRGLCLGE